MRKLYVRIYLAVLASLLLFAVAVGVLWRALGEPGPWRFHEAAATLAQNALPPASAPSTEQQAALEKLAAELPADAALFAADGSLLASVGKAPSPSPSSIRLRDGRRLEVRSSRSHGHAPYGLLGILALLALAIGIGAYPVVRRLTSRLERLQAGVESFGGGHLSARVAVEGRDEVARLAESFNRAAARIEELVDAHKSLLANASHELRTPLTRIRMAVELMKQSADAKRKAELEQDIAELDALIDEILLASRLGAESHRNADEEVDLLALAAEECVRYEGVSVYGQPTAVRGDPKLLRRMIRNLLDNAVRYGAPPIGVSIAHRKEAAEIRVSDAGPGVPEADRERVFYPFYRNPTRAQDATGTGLGLALVRQIAQRHEGNVRCEAPERGSCFVVSLPLAQPQ